MNSGEAWEKFMKSGNIEDYLAYRSEVTGKPNDVPSDAINNIIGAKDESTAKGYNHSGNGLWRKR